MRENVRFVKMEGVDYVRAAQGLEKDQIIVVGKMRAGCNDRMFGCPGSSGCRKLVFHAVPSVTVGPSGSFNTSKKRQASSADKESRRHLRRKPPCSPPANIPRFAAIPPARLACVAKAVFAVS